MTYNDFLTELKESKLKFSIVNKQQIRAVDNCFPGMYYPFCPICALTYLKTKEFIPNMCWDAAAEIIGLDNEDARKIVMMADSAYTASDELMVAVGLVP